MMETTHAGASIRRQYVCCKICRRIFEVSGTGSNPCPDCGSPYTLTRTEVSNLALQEKLYGTTNNPVWNEGLGTYTTGKTSRRVEAARRKLIPGDE
jgi:hypothetical protein